MMLSPSLCGAVAAVLLLPLLWTAIASALRLQLRGGAVAYGDRIEKLVLAIFVAPSAIGITALIAAALPHAPTESPPLLDFAFVESAVFAPIAPLPATPDSSPSLNAAWLLQASLSAFGWICAAGAFIAALRLIGAQARIRRIAARAQDASARWGDDTFITDADAPPFVGPRGAIILPRRLIAALTASQTAFVIAHERAHVRRGDAFYYSLLAWVDALFWFNPFLRAQTKRCRLAAELACDAAVTAAAPEVRRAYAQTLLLALKHTAGDALQCAPAVFSTRIVGEHRMRMNEIMHAAPGARKRSAWAVYVAAGLLAAPFAALQMAAAQPASPAPAPQVTSVSVAAPATALALAPLPGPIREAFGPRANPIGGQQQFHNGVDYDAAEGAPVVAPAAGRVTRAVYQGGYGNLLEIDHGAGLVTRYAHLSSFEVEAGAQISAGQTIARVGNTGRSTHPHLHFSVLRDGEHIDPVSVLPQ